MLQVIGATSSLTYNVVGHIKTVSRRRCPKLLRSLTSRSHKPAFARKLLHRC